MSKESFDSKLVTILLFKKLKFIFLGAIIGALLLGVPYALSKTIIGNFDYRSEVYVHVEYGEDSAGNELSYINHYTWAQWVTSDKYMEVLTKAVGTDNGAELKTYLNAELEADLRVVVFTVTSHDIDYSNRLAAAVVDTIEDFVREIPEVKDCEIINLTPAFKYFVFNNIPEVTILGAILGFVISAIFAWLWVLLDDSVYIPELFEKARNITLTDDDGLSDSEITGEIIIDKELIELPKDSDSVRLAVKCGRRNGKLIGNVLHQCEKKNIEIKSIRLIDKDEKLIRAYYKETTLSHLFMKNV